MDTDRRFQFAVLIESVPDGETADLAAIAPAGTTRVAIFPPYPVDEDGREVLGIDFPVSRASPWGSSEGGSLLVFASDTQVLLYFGVGWGVLDMACVGLPIAIDIAEARFTVERGADGLAQFVSAKVPGCGGA